MNPNIYKNQKDRSLRRKLEIIKEKGGCCNKCGYAKNLAALELHHVDPLEKEFQLDSRNLSNQSLKKIKIEMDKCELLCSNCHRELHNPNFELVTLTYPIKEEKRTILKPYKGICINCNTSFKASKGKKFCSKNCKDSYKNYPSLENINIKYLELKSWEKVANYFSLTRRIIQRIRHSNHLS